MRTLFALQFALPVLFVCWIALRPPRRLRAAGLLPAEPGAYDIYGAAVLAPCAGEVVGAVDGLPDMRVPETDRTHLAGNHLVVRLGRGPELPRSLRRPLAAVLV